MRSAVTIRGAPPTRTTTTAVVIVHGIGPQAPGGLVQRVAGGLEQFIKHQGTRPIDVQRVGDRIEFVYDRKRRRRLESHRVVLMESRWADTQLRPGMVRSAVWLMRFSPALIAFLVAPDQHDLDPSRSSFSRMLYRVAFPALILLSLAQQDLWWLVVAVGAACVASLAVRRANVIGDVVMAASDSETVERITEGINTTIDEAFDLASRVIVVGHSQGGYLSHLALRSRTGPLSENGRIELIGVGSGLKPITVLRRWNRSRDLAMIAVGLVGAGLVALGCFAFIFDALLGLRPLFDTTIPTAARKLVGSGDATPLPDPLQLVAPNAAEVGLLVVGSGILGATVMAMRAPVRRLAQHDLARPAHLCDWTEFTSASDTVGRMALPHLDDAQSIVVAGVGNPLLDHVSYFHLASPVTWHLARRAFPAAVLRDSLPVLSLWERYAEGTIARIRSFTCALGLVLLASYGLGRLGSASDGLAALTAQAHHPGWFFLWLLLLSAVAPALGAYDRVRLKRAVRERPLGLPPKRYDVPYAIRWTVFVMLVLLAVTAGDTGQDPVPYRGATHDERALLSIAAMLCQAGVIALACAFLAKYRPSLIALAALVPALAILSTYLPGNTGFFMAWMISVTAVVGGYTVLTRRFPASDPLLAQQRQLRKLPLSTYSNQYRITRGFLARSTVVLSTIAGALWAAGVIGVGHIVGIIGALLFFAYLGSRPGD